MKTERMTAFLCALLAICGSLSGSACTRAPQPGRRDAGGWDLLPRFTIVREDGVTEGGLRSPLRHEWVTRRGRRLDAAALVAPVAIRAKLTPVSGRFTLKLLASSLFNIGDGMLMEVFVGGPGTHRHICSRYFDAGRKAEDRDWIPLSVPLELSGHADTFVEIRVSAGPQGDLVADWLALAEARLDPEREAP
jgi:hypothetical protein